MSHRQIALPAFAVDIHGAQVEHRVRRPCLTAASNSLRAVAESIATVSPV
jgi:hypothetical protein